LGELLDPGELLNTEEEFEKAMQHTIDTYSPVFEELAKEEMLDRILRAPDWIGTIAMPETYTSYDYAFTCSSGLSMLAADKTDEHIIEMLMTQGCLFNDEEEYSLVVRFK
jgi:hypothetical protein